MNVEPILSMRTRRDTPAMPVHTTLPFHLPAVGRRKLTPVFDRARIRSDGGVILLGAGERQLGTRIGSLG